jgi:nucleoside-diphosphate-sugar epimerase
MQNVFLTGGNGFVGKVLTQMLLNRNYRVTLYGRNDDIRNYDNLLKKMSGHDFVIHLGALLGGAFVDTNIIGSLNVFKAAKEVGVKKIINMSSAAVYADGSINTPENENLSPKCEYGISKYTTEQYLRLTSLKYVNIRSSLVFGYGDKSNRVLNKMLESNPIVLFNSTDTPQMLDYVDVRDLCDFIIYSIENSDCDCDTFNISAGYPTDIFKLANIIQEIDTSRNVVIEDVAFGEASKVNSNIIRRKTEVKGCSLSISKVLEKTKWKPNYSISNMIRDYLSPN